MQPKPEYREDETARAEEGDGFSFDAFLSYSRKDSSVVQKLVSWLRERRVLTWFDEEQIDIGDTILDKIQDGLSSSRYLIVGLSKSYKDSEWCKREYQVHLEREIKERTVRVLPVRLDDYAEEEIPDLLFGKYAVDVRTEHGLARLVRKLKTHLPIQGLQPATKIQEPVEHVTQNTDGEGEGEEGLEALVQLWFPHPIARSFFDVSQEAEEGESVEAVRRCVDDVLCFLIVLCLADYAARHEITEIEPLLVDLDGKALSERIELLSKMLSGTVSEGAKKTFLPHLTDWALGPDGDPTRHFLVLFKLTLTLHAKGPGTAKRAQELLRRLLSSLRWLQSYRLIVIEEMDRPRPSLAKGKLKALVGVVKGFLPEQFLWQVSPTAQLKPGCYLVNAGKSGLLKLDPFLMTRQEIGARSGRVEAGDLWAFSGLDGSLSIFRESYGARSKISLPGGNLLAKGRTPQDRIVVIKAVDERLVLDLEDEGDEMSPQVDQIVEDAGIVDEDPDSMDLQIHLNHIQKMLLSLGGPFRSPERILVELDEIGGSLLNVFERFPQQAESFQEVTLEWSRQLDQTLETLTAEEMRLVLANRRREVEASLEDLLGGFSRTQSLFMNGSRYRGESPYASITSSIQNVDYGLKLLLSKDELDQSDGIDWLLRKGFGECEGRLRAIERTGRLDSVLDILWRRFPRIFLYYQDSFLDLAKLMLKADPSRWRHRFNCFSRVVEREVSMEEARSIIESLSGVDQSVIAAFLSVHVRRGCREIGMAALSPSDRWEILLAPGTHAPVVRELVEVTCKDCPPSYIKAMFLLLRNRLRSASTPLALNHAYEVLKVFYQVPLFLEAAFFKALLSVHRDLNRLAERTPEMAEVGRRFEEYLDEFRRKIHARDAGVTEMIYVPLPVQRKLARDGYFVDFFICSVRDPIALETVPHALRRADVIRFFKSNLVNKSALQHMAEDKYVMREPSIRAAFCRNPKADPKQVRKVMPMIGVSEFKLIAEDRSVSHYARTFAKELIRLKTS
jgi:hypothetical protein